MVKGVTGGYKGLQWVTRSYRALQEVNRGEMGYWRLVGVTWGYIWYKGLQEVTRGYKRLQGVTK